ncbi:MAG: lipopolysaccharide transport periplasmic protein LptA [Gammaproteobacteria bacterium]
MVAKSKLTSSVFLAGLFFVTAAAALSTDRDQPIEVTADFVEIDDKIGLAIYRGNVIVIQGSTRFTGHTLTLKYAPDQQLKEALLEGSPATYRQRPDNEEEDIKGEALNMRYQAQEQLIHMTNKVKIVQRRQIYTGHHMTYDTARNVLKARKARPGELSDDNGATDDGRVRIIIPPAKKTEPNGTDRGSRAGGPGPRE